MPVARFATVKGASNASRFVPQRSPPAFRRRCRYPGRFRRKRSAIIPIGRPDELDKPEFEDFLRKYGFIVFDETIIGPQWWD